VVGGARQRLDVAVHWRFGMPNGTIQFVVDEQGNRTAVLLDLQRYRELLEAQEELESVRAYDAAKASGDEAIPVEQAIREIEEARR
jgi:hypothetical protein